MKHSLLVPILVGLFVLAVLAACAPGATPAAPPTVPAPTVAPAATSPAQPTAAATAASGGGTTASAIPADHVGRTQCLVCHLTGTEGASKVPSADPDHTTFQDNPAFCGTCHQQAQ